MATYFSNFFFTPLSLKKNDVFRLLYSAVGFTCQGEYHRFFAFFPTSYNKTRREVSSV